MKRQAACLTFLCLVLISGTRAQDATEAPDDRQDYAIVFTSDKSRAYSDIYVIDPADKKIVPLVIDASAQHPVWSPTDGKLAFVSLQSDGEDIFILDFDNEVAINLTQNHASEGYPRWSPDGQRIAFATDMNGDWDVFVAGADGSGVTNLTDYPNADDGVWGLDWSPDGNQIVFTSDRNGR